MPQARKLISKSVIVSDKVKDYGNDPFVLKKNKDAKVFLEKCGFPKEVDACSSTKDLSLEYIEWQNFEPIDRRFCGFCID